MKTKRDTTVLVPLRLGKTVEDLPINGRVTMVVKISFMISLLWDYVDAILDTASNMRKQETKSLSREIKILRREFDQFLKFDQHTVMKSQELGELFEDINKSSFRQLSEGLREEIRRKITPPTRRRNTSYCLPTWQ